jgi:pimeloyl-ACP methyl ester carboxylesterase
MTLSAMLRKCGTLALIFSGTGAAFAACMPDGVAASGAKYRICMPDPGKWNGSLVLYAHGYVAFNEPVAIPDDQLTLPDGTSLVTLINGLGFGFGVTSYSVNGLAVTQGIQDLVDLTATFRTKVSAPKKTYLVGPSEGGIVTALSMEKHPDLYSGGLAACGPIGNFREQINYLGDFRVLFDYFFPGIIPGAAIQIPAEVINDWDAIYVPKIQQAIADNPSATKQLLSVSNAAIGSDPATVQTTVLDVLWYSTFSTNDAVQKLGGQPYDNSKKIYFGSSNDIQLNQKVKRFSADQAALNEMSAKYETSGKLTRPMVTMHTVADQIIPYWHEPLYTFKTLIAGTLAERSLVPVFRYGHCNFNALDALYAFGLLILKDTGSTLSSNAVSLLPLSQQEAFLKQAAAAGIVK